MHATTLLPSDAALTDEQWLDAVRLAPAPANNAQEPMRFAIEDEQGRVVQMVETTSLCEAVSIAAALRRLGLRGFSGSRHPWINASRTFRRPPAPVGVAR